MKPVNHISGGAVRLGLKNVDTDIILPAPYLKTITRRGLGRAAFESIRAKPGNIFDAPASRGAKIVIAGENFGCGSSREHAVWAMIDMGIEAVIAPSFSDIFSGNAFKNGLLAITLPQSAVDRLLASPEGELVIRLDAQTVETAAGDTFAFAFDTFRKHCLLDGLDEIGLTLAKEEMISAFEDRAASERSWLPSIR